MIAMKRFFNQLIGVFLIFSISLVFTVNAVAENNNSHWHPEGSLSEIPFHFDCDRTGNDLAIATADGIYWCREFAERLERKFPGITEFYYVHEYGHYVVGLDELATDCWAAKQLAGTIYIKIAIDHFNYRGNEYIEGYGYMTDRAKMIEKCSNEK